MTDDANLYEAPKAPLSDVGSVKVPQAVASSGRIIPARVSWIVGILSIEIGCIFVYSEMSIPGPGFRTWNAASLLGAALVASGLSNICSGFDWKRGWFWSAIGLNLASVLLLLMALVAIVEPMFLP